MIDPLCGRAAEVHYEVKDALLWHHSMFYKHATRTSLNSRVGIYDYNNLHLYKIILFSKLLLLLLKVTSQSSLFFMKF